MNPLHEETIIEDNQELTTILKDGKITRKEILAQLPLPWRKKEHRFDPTFYKCEGKKIVKYESKDLKIWGVSLIHENSIVFIY